MSTFSVFYSIILRKSQIQSHLHQPVKNINGPNQIQLIKSNLIAITPIIQKLEIPYKWYNFGQAWRAMDTNSLTDSEFNALIFMKVKINWLPDDVRFSEFNNIFCYVSWICHLQTGTKESSDLINFLASQWITTTYIMNFCKQLKISPILTSTGNSRILADSSLFFEFHWFLSPSASTGSELMIFTNFSLKFN